MKNYFLRSHVFGDYYTNDGKMSYKTDNIKYFETEDEAYNEALQKKLSYMTVFKKKDIQ